jgi:hypothetical protein
VPYRENKLTRVFQTYFEGNNDITMIVNLNPSASCIKENEKVLEFTSIIKDFQIRRDSTWQKKKNSISNGENASSIYGNLYLFLIIFCLFFSIMGL